MSKCAFCPSTATLTCVGCWSVQYCSKEHQRSDWKRHKAHCRTHTVKNSDQQGRYLVASRELRAGSLLLRSRPLVFGPNPESGVPSCILCLKPTDGEDAKKCECGLAICKFRCDSKLHCREECEFVKLLLAKRNFNYNLLLPLRILLKRKSQPKIFEALLRLQSHQDALKLRLKDDNDVLKCRVLDKLIEHFDEESIASAVGVVLTNGFEVLKQGKVAGIAMYERPSLMNHDCVGSVRLVMDERDLSLSVYAATDLNQGDELSFNYGHPLDTSSVRRQMLQEHKFFNCHCKRCLDPTELGSFTSALCCPHCNGPVIMDANLHKCYECHKIMKKKVAENTMERVSTMASRMESGLSAIEIELMLKALIEGKMVHEQHGLVVRLRQQLIMQDDLRGISEEERLEQRLGLCEAVMKVLDIVEPGLTLSRGLVLYHRQSLLVCLANVRFESSYSGSLSSVSPLLRALEQARVWLRSSTSILDLEPEESSLHKQFFPALHMELEELDNYIEMVEQIA